MAFFLPAGYEVITVLYDHAVKFGNFVRAIRQVGIQGDNYFPESCAETRLQGGRLPKVPVEPDSLDVWIALIDDPDLLPKAKLIETVPAPKTGYVKEVNAREIGIASVALGAGRMKKGDPIDPAVGFVIHHKVGDRVEKGAPLFTVHANSAERLAEARERALAAHQFSREKVRRLPLFYKTVV